jgi:hypothetical protein
MKLLARYGYWEDIYQSTCNFSCIGHVFGAPIWCDGAVYVATAGGVFAKYSADGKRQWMTWSFNPGNTNLAGSGQDTCVRSPIVSGDLLISTAANNLVALDRATGGIRFKDTLPAPRNYESISTPAVMTVDGKGILLTAGPRAYRLPDGRPLKIEGWLISGMQALVKHDERDVVFFCGSGEHCTWPNKGFGIDTPPPAAVRYALEGDVLRGTVLWAGVQDPAAIATRANPAPPYSKVHDAGGEGGNAPWLLYDKGRLYHRDGAILDALTGKIVAGKLASRIPQDRAAPRTAHLLQLAGGYVYGWGNNLTDPVQVYTADGKFVAANPFVRPTLTKEQLPVWRGVDSSEGYGNMLSYGSQFTFGKDCLVMRTLMHLYCFSDGAQLPPPSPDR